MCFSASVSFGASAALAGIGTTAVIKARTAPQRVFAGIPIMFAMQQFTEGVLWLALLHPQYAQYKQFAMYAFLFFAQVAWPVYLPLSVLLLEPIPKRKKQLSVFLAGGLLVGGYLAYCLCTSDIQAFPENHHIRYKLGFALSGKWFFGLLYFIPTIIAPFFSGIKPVRLLGIVFLLCYIIARLLFHLYVVSVWCFFCTIISIVVLWIIIQMRNSIIGKR